MQQLFQNLLANALKFRRPDVEPVVRVTADTGPDGVRIAVSDNGIGFSDEYAERIFGLFQRLHPRGTFEGTGIGLAISRKIVEGHGGTLTAAGTPGAGATFVVTLPPTDDMEER
jgi:signal transduction histidine kinase